MKLVYTLLFCSLFLNFSFGQGKFITKKGNTSFFSHAPIEDITAENDQVLSIIDTSTGNIAVSMLMKSFMFEKLLMQEHFNENYVESDKYPKATFNGKILNFQELSEYETITTIEGTITIHGVSNNVETKAKIIRTEDNIIVKGNFIVEVADFDIKIPGVVINNIAKNIKVAFKLDHQPYNK